RCRGAWCPPCRRSFRRARPGRAPTAGDWGCTASWRPPEEWIVRIEHRCPLETDPREIGREHVFALRPGTALDPRDEIAECLLPRLAIETTVTGGAHDSLPQQVVGAGGDRAAPVGLLEAQRHPRVAGLVQRDERRREPAGPFCVHGVRAR